MAEPLAALSLYRRLVGAQIRSQLQYRVSFALDLFGAFLISFVDLAAILVIFHNVPQLAGWSLAEVALLYAISMLAFAFTDLVVGHFDLLPQLLRTGGFDQLLVRPRSTLLQVVASDFQFRRLGKALQALIVLGYALTAAEVDWTLGRAAMIPLSVVSGFVIFTSVWIFAICIVFWAIEGGETANTFTYGGSYFAQYPINLFDAWLRRLLAYVIPTAFVAYFPALYVLDKHDPLGLPTGLQFASPLVAIAAAAAAALMWRFAVRHYRSAGG